MTKRDLPEDTQVLVNLYKNYSLRQIAKRYNVPHQTIAYRLRHIDTSKPDLSRRNEEIRKDYACGIDINLIADSFDLSLKRVRAICTGVRRPRKQPGCPDCETKHYARGWCKKCYTRWLRNSANVLE